MAPIDIMTIGSRSLAPTSSGWSNLWWMRGPGYFQMASLHSKTRISDRQPVKVRVLGGRGSFLVFDFDYGSHVYPTCTSTMIARTSLLFSWLLLVTHVYAASLSLQSPRFTISSSDASQLRADTYVIATTNEPT